MSIAARKAIIPAAGNIQKLAGGKQGNLKEFVDERLSYSHAAVGWILANKHIDCAALTMDNYSMVENFVAASGNKLERTDLDLFQANSHR